MSRLRNFSYLPNPRPWEASNYGAPERHRCGDWQVAEKVFRSLLPLYSHLLNAHVADSLSNAHLADSLSNMHLADSFARLHFVSPSELGCTSFRLESSAPRRSAWWRTRYLSAHRRLLTLRLRSGLRTRCAWPRLAGSANAPPSVLGSHCVPPGAL
jgi:hypothetical protein